MTYQIRPATLQDTPALADLLHEIGLFAQINQQPAEATVEQVTHQMSRCLSDDSHSIWVAESTEGLLLGYLSAHWLPYLIHAGAEGYISELFVRESARSLGIGTALLETAVAEGQRRGCGRMALINLRHRESYLRGYYKKHGWQERPDAANFILPLK